MSRELTRSRMMVAGWWMLVLAAPFTFARAEGETAKPGQPIRSGAGWAIHAQRDKADWEPLVAKGNLVAGTLVRVEPEPNDHNTGSELKRLTDGELAGADGRMWSDKRALGWAYQPHARITIDLGASRPVGRVVMRMQVISETSTLPSSIKVALSDDGDEFSLVRRLDVRTPGATDGVKGENAKADGAKGDIPAATYESLPFDPPGIYAVVLDVGHKARHVRLDFALRGTLVMDELAILPADGAVRPIPPAPKVETEYRDYVFDRRDQYRRMIRSGNLLLGKELRYSPAPTQYLTVDEHDPKQLTDGKFSERVDEAIWFERSCVGWQGPPLVTIFADLGERQPIEAAVIRLLGGAAQNALEFPDDIRVLLSDDGREYHLAASRHKRGLDDLSADTYSLPEVKVAWVHNFKLPVQQRARYVAVQIAHKKQFIVSDEMALVKGAADLPDFKPSPQTRVTLVTEGVAFEPVWGNSLPVCANLPLKSRLQKIDARVGAEFDKPCHIVMDVPETMSFETAGAEPTEVKHNDRTFRRYRFPWAGEGTEFYLQSKLPAGGTDVVHVSGDRGKGLENERVIPWRSLVIPAARVPKRLHVSLSWAESVVLLKTWPRYLEAQRHLGFNAVGTMPCYWRESDVPTYQTALAEIRKAGLKVVQIESPAGAVDGDRHHAETKSVLEKGPSEHVCPSYRGTYYKKEHDSFAQHAVWIRPDLIFYDIEAYWGGSVDTTRCRRCLERFGREGFTDHDRFRAALGREIHVQMKATIDKALADPELSAKIVYGSYRTEPITPLNDGLFSFGNTYPDLLQMAMPSLYVAGNPLAVAENIAANRAQMKTNDIVPWFSTGCYGEYDPERTRDMILEAFANGARGVTYYWYGHFDAGHFRSHAQAVDIVAPVEDIFMDGKPLPRVKCGHDKVKVCGMGLDIDGKAGATKDGTGKDGAGKDGAGKPDAETHKTEQAVLVSNYQGVPRGTRVTVDSAAAAGTPVWDLHRGKQVGVTRMDGAFEVTLDEYPAHLYYVGRKFAAAVER